MNCYNKFIILQLIIKTFIFPTAMKWILSFSISANLSQCKFSKYISFRHTGIPGLWTQELHTGLWTLDSGRWTLGSGPWTLSLNVVEQNQNSVSDFTWLND